MWQGHTDQTEATNFTVELLKCGNSAEHFIVYGKADSPNQNQACMIHNDLGESYSLHQERTHLAVVGCLPDEDVCPPDPESGG